jgi:hypothetical protein
VLGLFPKIIHKLNLKIMKSLDEILKQKPIFLHLWDSKESVTSSFERHYSEEITKEKKEYYDSINILFASYGEDNYSGDAFVLFEKDGCLYEVNGSHCSCYGLEDQFEPEGVTLEAIKMRLVDGNMGRDSWSDNEFYNELSEFIGVSVA